MKTPYELFHIECGPGWKDIIDPVIDACIKEGAAILQIKEKFGGLRFYIASGSDGLWKLIEEAEELSYTVCEECGEAGSLREGGWMRTLCDEHAKVHGYD